MSGPAHFVVVHNSCDTVAIATRSYQQSNRSIPCLHKNNVFKRSCTACGACRRFNCACWDVQAQVAEMDAELEDTQAEFQQLDDKMARVSQVATRIGDRLRVRAPFRCGAVDHICAARRAPTQRPLLRPAGCI